MKKFASHFIWFQGERYRLHYIIIEETGKLSGIFPLEQEQAGTAFFNGVLIPMPVTDIPQATVLEEELMALSEKVTIGSVVHLYQLDQGCLKQVL